MEKPNFLQMMLKDFEDLRTHPVYSKMPPVVFDDSIKLLTRLVKGECTIDTILDGATEREKKSYNFLLGAVQGVETLRESLAAPDIIQQREDNTLAFMSKVADGNIEASQEISRLYTEKYKEIMLERENYEELDRLKKANKI